MSNNYASFAEAAASFKGKTIENVSAEVKDHGAAELIIYFTDGTEARVTPEITFHGNDEHAAEAIITIE